MDASRTTLDDCLDELCARFLNNLPESELQEFSRIGMHLEEAQWFYEDFIRPQNPAAFPNLRIRDFALRVLQHCPVTSIASIDILEKAYDNWVAYKKRIPVRGLIMLNEAMDSAVLVKGWKSSANWSFPRGKINEEEDDLNCAIREVYEETGFNVEEAGLIPDNRKVKFFEQTIRDQHLRLYVIPDVPMDTYFEPRTRKEISKIQWYKLADLPGRVRKKPGQDINTAGPNASKFYMVAPFMEPLNRWIKQQMKKKEKIRSSRRTGPALQAEIDEIMTEEEGMATDTRADLPPPPDAKDPAHEEATRQLQRLLKIQPPLQTIHGPLHQTQERGQDLLAMLQKQSDVLAGTQPNSAQAGVNEPHAQMGPVYYDSAVPNYQQHDNHNNAQRPPLDQQALPHFPSHSGFNNQLLSVLEAAGSPARLGLQQAHAVYQQQQQMQMSPKSNNQPGLVHPQPLPPQANHLLANTLVPNPASEIRTGQMHQQANMWPQFAAGMALPQQNGVNARQLPAPLDNTRQALLDAFKKNTPIQQAAQQNSASTQPLTGNQRPNQQFTAQNLASLGSTYSLAQNSTQSMLVATNGSPQISAAQAALRPSNVPESQRNALLGLFKQPTTSSPIRQMSQINLKENSSPRLQKRRPDLDETGSAAMQANDGSPQGNRGLQVPLGGPYGAQYASVSLWDSDQRSTQSQTQPAHTVRAMGDVHRASYNPSINSLLYRGTSQVGQATAQGSMHFLPNGMQQHQAADPQQLQKLMSLFSKPSSTPASTHAPSLSAHPTSVLANNGKEPATFNMGLLAAQLPTTSSNSTSLGTLPGMDEATMAASTSRRSSQQVPISPENERFLLNYLKTVSSSAK